eukprot:CAMPEP_0206060824 /NCGR_PEP_ID=MMETSP1466-20131121/52379_1 /ASSEMBLY_ACC=CAM_ASM_001126 /TAXON_ID=44452 /ORGANISM="Pavlova gyrans, Strain CCMP608" /LENGTH=101 /DNA_ID=CAMNT_0053436167 /DNA_START=1 /DNA_END=303 /DNA_ORIENTATION=+
MPLDLSLGAGIALRVRGNGARFKCILRDSDEWNGVAWTASFNTRRGESVVRLPFSSFVPTRFAKTIPDSPPLNTRDIKAMQLSLSKFEYDGGLNPTFKEGP